MSNKSTKGSKRLITKKAQRAAAHPSLQRSISHVGCALAIAFGVGLSVLPFSAIFAQEGNSNSQLEAILDTATLPTIQQLARQHPDSIDYQMAYINAFKKNTTGANWNNMDSIVQLLVPLYTKWMQRHPTAAALPLALGQAFANAESPEAKPYLLKAAAIDPNNAKVWSTLSIDAERWGDDKGAMAYMHKAALAAPKDPGYAFYDAMNYEQVDPKMWREQLYELAKKYPESERGAQGLYWLANRSQDPTEKLATFEKLKTLYPPSKFSWSESGMTELFYLYLQRGVQNRSATTTTSVQDFKKAKALAGSLIDKAGWPKLDSLADAIIDTRHLINQGKYAAAMHLIQRVKLPRYPDMASLMTTLYAQAAAKAGHPDSSYIRLARLYAAEPTEKLMTDIKSYAKQLHYNTARIQRDIQHLRAATARPAPELNLGLYTSTDKVNWSDFKGKVVLLTFWFPGCGPCRGEFPHFQKVINQFNAKQVAYIGINVTPSQDPYVLPFMKGTGYTFIPLRGTSDWAWENYKVRGEPTNFLIDPQGNIIFSDFRIDGNNEQTLELMIKELMKKS